LRPKRNVRIIRAEKGRKEKNAELNYGKWLRDKPWSARLDHKSST
jgi:hypothetical protein